MPTVIKPLDDDVREFLDNMLKGIYLEGQCYEMAIALHRGLNWPLIGFVQDMYGQSVIRHAAVRHPENGFFDGRGWVSEQNFFAPFGEKGSIITFELETELKHRTRPIQESGIKMAGKLAMSRWPELPWVADTYFQKIGAFLNDIERVCRRHGFWFSSPTAAGWPMIVTGENDEVGYALATTGNGAYTANRLLKVEQDIETHANRLRTLGVPDEVVTEVVRSMEPERD